MGYRYLGTKTKLLNKILSIIMGIVPKGGHVTDLMCGTGAVSSALRINGYRVTAVDLMSYSYHHARVALLFTSQPEFNDAKGFIRSRSRAVPTTIFPLTPYEQMFNMLNSGPKIKGYFWKEFSIAGKPSNGMRPRNYFSPDNAMIIDGIRLSIKELFSSGQINALEHSLLLHDLIMAANDIANIAGTYGHYLSKISGRANCRLLMKPTNLLISKDGGRHAIIKGYAEEIAKDISCDLCYIDPPYMKRQYAANYHILETIAREDEPAAIGLSGLRPWRDQYSNFCTKTKIRGSFARIFENMKCQEYLISYSEDGLLKLEELKNIFNKYGKVSVSAIKYKRFKSNKSKLKQELTEYLIHVKK